MHSVCECVYDSLTFNAQIKGVRNAVHVTHLEWIHYIPHQGTVVMVREHTLLHVLAHLHADLIEGLIRAIAAGAAVTGVNVTARIAAAAHASKHSSIAIGTAIAAGSSAVLLVGVGCVWVVSRVRQVCRRVVEVERIIHCG